MFKIQVHYLIGHTVNVDYYTCDEYEIDNKAGVLRFQNGKDQHGSVKSVQYKSHFRILTRTVTDEE
jgi:hypothetical protein